MTGATNGDRDAFPFNRADVGCGELAQGVRSNQDGIAGMDHATFNNTGYDGTDEGYGEGVIDVELKGGFGVVISVVRKNVEKGPDEIE